MNLYASPRYGGDYQVSAAINCTGVIYDCYSCPGLAELVWLYWELLVKDAPCLHLLLTPDWLWACTPESMPGRWPLS